MASVILRTTALPLVAMLVLSWVLPCLPNPDSSNSNPDSSNSNPDSSNSQADSHSEGDIQIVGGQVEGTGNILLYHEGKWGVICDDGWNLKAAQVACRMAGFPYALGHTTQAYFGAPTEGE